MTSDDSTKKIKIYTFDEMTKEMSLTEVERKDLKEKLKEMHRPPEEEVTEDGVLTIIRVKRWQKELIRPIINFALTIQARGLNKMDVKLEFGAFETFWAGKIQEYCQDHISGNEKRQKVYTEIRDKLEVLIGVIPFTLLEEIRILLYATETGYSEDHVLMYNKTLSRNYEHDQAKGHFNAVFNDAVKDSPPIKDLETIRLFAHHAIDLVCAVAVNIGEDEYENMTLLNSGANLSRIKKGIEDEENKIDLASV